MKYENKQISRIFNHWQEQKIITEFKFVTPKIINQNN